MSPLGHGLYYHGVSLNGGMLMLRATDLFNAISASYCLARR